MDIKEIKTIDAILQPYLSIQIPVNIGNTQLGNDAAVYNQAQSTFSISKSFLIYDYKAYG